MPYEVVEVRMIGLEFPPLAPPPLLVCSDGIRVVLGVSRTNVNPAYLNEWYKECVSLPLFTQENKNVCGRRGGERSQL